MVLDIIIVATILIFVLADAFWGLINVVIAIGGVFLGIVVAGIFADPLSNAIVFVDDKTVAKGIAFVLIVFLFGFIGHIVSFVLGMLPLFGLLNHVLGAILGLVQGVLVAAVILVGAVLVFPDWSQGQLQQSLIAKAAVKPLSSAALSFAPDPLKTVVQTFVQQYQ